MLCCRNAPPRALSDLKKQLQSHNVRKSITNSILSSIGVDQDLSSSMQSQPRSDILRPESSFSSHREPQRPNSVLSTRSISNGEAASKEASMASDSIHGGMNQYQFVARFTNIYSRSPETSPRGSAAERCSVIS